MASMLPLTHYVTAWGLSRQRLWVLASQERIRDAQGRIAARKIGRDWMVLDTAVRPPQEPPGRKPGPETPPEPRRPRGRPRKGEAA